MNPENPNVNDTAIDYTQQNRDLAALHAQRMWRLTCRKHSPGNQPNADRVDVEGAAHRNKRQRKS